MNLIIARVAWRMTVNESEKRVQKLGDVLEKLITENDDLKKENEGLKAFLAQQEMLQLLVLRQVNPNIIN